MRHIIARLAEGSSWAGIAAALVALGMMPGVEEWRHIVAAGSGAAGLIAVLLRDTGAQQ